MGSGARRRGRAGLLARRGVRASRSPARVAPSNRRQTRPSSTPMRRSTRCPTWASNGPTWTRPTRARARAEARPPRRRAGEAGQACRSTIRGGAALCRSRIEGLGAAASEELLKRVPASSRRSRRAEDKTGQCRADRPAGAGRCRAADQPAPVRRAIIDAEVEPGDQRCEGERIAVELRAAPGPRYTLRVGRVSRAWPKPAARPGTLREAFAVKPGDPVVAQTGHRGRDRAQGRARRAGLRHRRDRRAGHRHRP